eukprot:GEMP01008552.1.p1 GENE.GEMP01008552.1~~GEMP01008552.1.p1  ORF type:complete len:863 (+),score=175.09 GEMP01008552.1:429-3017(+)
MDDFRRTVETSQLLRDCPPLKQHRARREYWAAVNTKFKAAKKEVDEPMGESYSPEDRVRFLDNLMEIFFHEQLVRRQVLDFIPNILRHSAWKYTVQTMQFQWRLNLWSIPDEKAVDLAVSLLKTEVAWPGYEGVIVPNQLYFEDLVKKCIAENLRNSSTSRIKEVLDGEPAQNPDVPPEQRPSLDTGEYTKKKLVGRKGEKTPKAEEKSPKVEDKSPKAEDKSPKEEDKSRGTLISRSCKSESVIVCRSTVAEEPARSCSPTIDSETMADFRRFLVSQKAVRMLPTKLRHGARRTMWADMYAKFKAARKEVPQPFDSATNSQARVVTWDNILDVFANDYMQRRQVLEVMAVMLRVPRWADSLRDVANIWRLDLWNHADNRTVDVAVAVLKTKAKWVGYESVVAPNRAFFIDVMDKCKDEKVLNESVNRICELLNDAKPVNPEVPEDLRPSLKPGTYDGTKIGKPKSKKLQFSETQNPESAQPSSSSRDKPITVVTIENSAQERNKSDFILSDAQLSKLRKSKRRNDVSTDAAPSSYSDAPSRFRAKQDGSLSKSGLLSDIYREKRSLPLQKIKRNASDDSHDFSRSKSASQGSNALRRVRRAEQGQRSLSREPKSDVSKTLGSARSALNRAEKWSGSGLCLPGNPSNLPPPEDTLGEVGLQHYKNLARVDLRRRLTEAVADAKFITEYLTYWQKWMEDRIDTKVPRRHTNMSDVEAKERKWQAELWRTLAFEEVLHLDGGWFSEKKDERTYLNCVGTEGDRGNNCVGCGIICYDPPIRIGKHRPRYCEVCHAWYCGDCKKKSLQKGRRTMLPGYGSFDVHRCKKLECERGVATVPLDPGTGGVLRDHVFVLMHVEKWKTKKG